MLPCEIVFGFIAPQTSDFADKGMNSLVLSVETLTILRIIFSCYSNVLIISIIRKSPNKYEPVRRFQNSLRIVELFFSYYFVDVFSKKWNNSFESVTAILGITLVDIVGEFLVVCTKNVIADYFGGANQ